MVRAASGSALWTPRRRSEPANYVQTLPPAPIRRCSTARRARPAGRFARPSRAALSVLLLAETRGGRPAVACSCSACSASSSIVGEAASSGASDAAVARALGDLLCWSRRWAAAVCSLGAARAGEVCLGEGVRYSSIA